MAASSLRLASGASLPVILSDESEVLTEHESALLLSVVEVPPPDPVPEGYVQEYIDTFSGAGPEGIAVGDVLVLAGCPAAPDGLLHKVLAIEPLGATTVMRTEQASLEDAVQSVDLNYGQPIEEDDLEEATFLREGVKLVESRGAAKKLGFDLAWQIDCEHDGLRASGRLELSQKFDVNVKISWFKLQSARFVRTTSESTESS